jgi:branched-chain amino acid transport system permease protein
MLKLNNYAWLLAISAALVGGSTLLGSGFAANLCIWLAISTLLAASFRFVQLIGELNFALAGFVGVGAYASGICSTLLSLPFWMGIVAAAAAAGLLGLIGAFVTLRAKGPYFMLISFAFTEALRMIYTQIPAIGGNSGMIGIFPPDYLATYYPAFVVSIVILLLWALYAIEQSDFGKVLVAIRNSDAVVQAVGINVHWAKVVCVGISSMAAGICGVLQANTNNVISPGDFSFLLAVYTLAAVKVGGESHILGAVLGAVVLTLLSQVALSFGPYEHIFYGAAIVLAVLILPNGLIGVVGQIRKAFDKQNTQVSRIKRTNHGH